MSEELLKAIIRLFSIVARERVTEAERANISDFLMVHVDQASIPLYLNLFDQYNTEIPVEVVAGAGIEETVDDNTKAFLEEWGQVINITKKMNQALTKQQKVFLVIKIVELLYADGDISERQDNLIFYIGESLKLNRNVIMDVRQFVMGLDPEDLSSNAILIVDEGSGENDIEGPRMVSKNLTGLIAVLRVPSIETYFIKYLGISTLNLNGTNLKSRKIYVLPNGSTIKGNKIETIYYSQIVTNYLRREQETAISFEAKNLFYHFQDGKLGLQNINIAEEGGKLVGIMGSSGSGKTTLLNLLNGSERPSSGYVKINGISIHEDPEKLEGVIGYIPQDDLLIEELTVFQNLYFAARLCFSDYNKEELTELVDIVIRNLGLGLIRDLKVGSPMDKTISGGQRKRVNIGLELLREPTVLFVDEPTSGLSSRDSENIMDLMKELSMRGTMIFVVIHQPSSDIFKLFDDLIILDTGGWQIYYGNPVEALEYFKDRINAANRMQGVCPECGNISAEQIFNIIDTRVVDEYGRLTQTRKISPAQWYEFYNKHITPRKINTVDTPLHGIQKIPGWFRQWRVFSLRDALSKLSNTQYWVINLIQAPLLALFISLLVKYYAVAGSEGVTYSFYHNDNIPVYFFMSIIVVLFLGLTVSAEEIFRDRKILKREQFLHLSRSSYLLSKIAILFLISAVQTFLFMLIGNYVLELYEMGFRYWLILFSTACFANLLGLNVSATFNSAVTIYILIPILLIPQLILSGVVINFDKFHPKVTNPEGVPLIGEFMASRWAFEASMVTQFRDNSFERLFFEHDQSIAMAEYKKVYLIPRLESELSFCFQNLNSNADEKNKVLGPKLRLLKNEFIKEAKYHPDKPFELVNELTPENFDLFIYQKAGEWLGDLKNFYSIRYLQRIERKEAYLEELEAEGIDVVALKLKYQNEAVQNAVTGAQSTVRIIQDEDRLVQKVSAAYFNEHNPSHPLKFRTKFYAPGKPFLGKVFDTVYFNILVIWMMTLILFGTLYFDVFRRILVTTSGFKRKNKRA